MQDLKKQKYEEVFEDTLLNLEYRRQNDPDFNLVEMKRLIETEYVNQGNDWVGRGGLFDVVEEATLAAYELFYSRWRQEEKE